MVGVFMAQTANSNNMSYFDDQWEAWMENDCQGMPEDYEGDQVADLLIQKAERQKKT